ncbi:Alanyl dipeptidyl peptidase [Giardia duodenalis]|uniref:Dipeptidyl-peptidase 4 n=2 Tax=Giardia intestinalis TaxID=5741 RepID=DPP_GIAIN|nr:Alanyl dipeptidyl peptidase [Giardia intestinalis]Q95WU5.1 RecName: Full=Dipeptidyl-peptidase 4; AltName: Full=Dipeptidyl-aminopeptidase; AltName: Full=Dipeptidylpeptidase IV; Short=DPP IV; Flags: Precursor [Giardia intestinalis]AAK97082.1 dipeptidyl-aminopeptidase [Giardia intestinalis]KAE8301352.1 Alanyl dipeptidyl peptidase [Giardia intestinalis]|eukprot:XP_001707929.1 Alanyl dipeptidyl peptidase [Giardia lamblia ATCC 50803]
MTLSAWIILVTLAMASVLTPEDNVRLRRLTAYVANADASIVLLTYTEYEEGTNHGNSMLWRINDPLEAEYPFDPDDISLLNAERVCPELVGVGDLQYSTHNQAFYFTAQGPDGTSQVYSYNHKLETCTQISFLPISVSNLKVSPKGNSVLFSAEIFVYPNNHASVDDPLNFAHDEFARIQARPYKAFAYEQLYTRHWDEDILPSQYRHLFAARLERSSEYDDDYVRITVDNSIDLMPRFDGDCPMRPFADASSYTFDSHGRYVAFVTQVGSTAAFYTNDSIWITDLQQFLDAKKPVRDVVLPLRCATCWNKARDQRPAFSYDGIFLYYASMDEEQSESDLLRLRKQNVSDLFEYDCDSLFCGPVTGEGVFNLTAGVFDRSIGQFIIPTDSTEDSIYILAEDHARTNLFRYNEESSTVTRLTYNGTLGSLLYLRHNKIFLATMSSYTRPTDLVMLDLTVATEFTATRDPSDTMKDDLIKISYLTDLNRQRLRHIDELQEPEEFYLPSKSFPDQYVHSWYFAPANLRDSHEYPLILYVHGGPESPWANSWSYRWNPQLIAARGYGVLATNFHGSSSFGEVFQKSVRGNWYSYPLEDIMDAWSNIYTHADKAYLSREKVCAMGASFGATFMNYMNSHVNNVTCYVTHDGVFDTMCNALETDELFFPVRELGGFLLDEQVDNQQLYEKWNPARFVENMSAPMLVIHGQKDYRIQVYHGISLFQALRLRGIKTKLVYFPTQSHWVWQPQESLFWHTQVFDWLDTYL